MTDGIDTSPNSPPRHAQGVQGHTPGPWTHTGGVIWDDSNNAICDMAGPIGSKILEANARLIAAAPDMLGALKVARAIMSELTTDSLYDDAKEAVRAAIAKATGG